MPEQEADMMQEAREALAARKENRRKQNPTEIAQKMYRMNFAGNIIPHSWYIHIKRENGKPYTIAIVLLSEIVYWYRPKEVKDEKTGQVIGLQKRYAADKLQRTYDSFADQFGFTKRQVKDALKYLEDMAIIDLDLRDIPVGDSAAGNVLFIGLDPDRLAEITYLPPSDEKTIDPLPSDELESQVYQFKGRGLTENGQTNTETSRETTPEITEEKTSFSAKKSDSDFPSSPVPPAPSPGGDADSGKEQDHGTDIDTSIGNGAVVVGGLGDDMDQTQEIGPDFAAGTNLYWQHLREAEANKGGNWADPAQAGGDDAVAFAALNALYDGEPPKPESGIYTLAMEKLGLVLAQRGVRDAAVGRKAGELMREANRKNPAFLNPALKTFESAFDMFVAEAQKQGSKAPDRATRYDTPAVRASQAAWEERRASRGPPTKDDRIGAAIKDQLHAQMTRPTYDTYIGPTRFTCDDGVLVVTAPTAFTKDWLENRLGLTIRRALRDFTDGPQEIRFEVKDELDIG